MYRVLVALRQDMNEGWVWLSDGEFNEPRSIIRITNKENGKRIFCECLQIDDNFLKEYNQPHRISIKKDDNVIVMNEWYRRQLGGIEPKATHNLEICAANNFWGRFMASVGHPQVVVRLATWLALISVALGFIGVFLGVASCLK
jgi:hypothetical protein